jgi:hypothetical protein
MMHQRRVLDMTAMKDDLPGCPQASIAELSRPNRVAKERERERQYKKHQPGRKRTRQKQDAVYHNWHGPFTWAQIDNAAKHPSVMWSSARLVQYLQKKDPTIFKGLARSTIEGWIDRSGKPRWTDAAVRMAELGNHQGHSKGGKRGILVRMLTIQLVIDMP